MYIMAQTEMLMTKLTLRYHRLLSIPFDVKDKIFMLDRNSNINKE